MPSHPLSNPQQLTLDDASPSLLVKALGVALLDLLKGGINVDLDERDLALLVDGTGELTVGEVRRDEGGEGRGSRRGYELGDLLSRGSVSREGWMRYRERERTSPTRRMFSSRSLGENPRSLLRPKRTLSPSRRKARLPFSSSSSSRAQARVDLPDPVQRSERERSAQLLVLAAPFRTHRKGQ